MSWFEAIAKADQCAIVRFSQAFPKFYHITTTRRKILFKHLWNSIFYCWSYSMWCSTMGEMIKANWNCLYCKELKSCSIKSPRVWNWNCLYCGEIKSCHLYQFPTSRGGLKSKILCAIWECQFFAKEKKGLGKISPFVTCGKATRDS